MALRFMDGADYYPSADLGLKWTSFANQSVSSTTRYSVGQSITYSGVGRVQKTIDAQSTWIIGHAIRHPIVGGNGGSVGSIIELLSTTTTVATVQVSAGGVLSVTAIDNASGSHTLCSCTVKLNGVTECTFAATSGGSTIAASTANVIRFNGPLNAAYFIDDIYICDGTGSAPYNDFLGDCRIGTQRPNGAGYSTQWTPDSSTNFSRVNETTENGDTSYVTANSAALIDSYTMAALPTTPASVLAVQANAVAKNDAGSHTFQINTRISGVNYTSSTFTLTASYAIYSQLQTASPATSVAWTPTEVANYEIGLNLIS